VDDALFMGGFEGFRDLRGDGERLIHGHRTSRDTIGQRLSFNELENETGRPFEGQDIVDRADVDVVQRGENFCLTLKTLHALGISV
jgi:hypothetical protein